MIQRRRPIESAIAERKMFNMGGMAASMPQPTYMDLMQQGIMGMPQQPMGMPQQPQGIMASSQPLVDAIAADAVNPQGGGTLSEDDGTLSMAQGGLASQQDGISTITPRVDRETVRFSPGVAVYDAANPTFMPISRIMSETSSERLKRLFPESARNAFQLSFDKRFPEFEAASKRGEPYSRVEEYGARFLVGARDLLGDAFADIGQDIGSLGSYLFSRETRADKTNLVQTRAVDEMIQRRPDLKEDIRQFARAIITNEPDVSVEALTEQIADQISEKREIYPNAGYIEASRDAQMDPNDPEPFEYTPPPSVEDDETTFFEEDLAKDIKNYEIATADGPQARTKFAQNLSARTDVTDDYKMEVLKAAEGFGQPPVDQGPLPPEDAAAIAATFDTPDAPREVGAPPPALGSKPSTERFYEGLVPGGGSEKTADPNFQMTEDDLGGTGFDTAAQQAATILDKEEKASPKDIAAFKKEFMDAVPEYEGASEEERGWAIAEAGLRVMAGKSPNAITNIAKGLQGLGPQFAKDAKEERAWKRQVELSAVKYGIERFNKAEAEERKLETTTEKLIGIGNGSFKLPNGKTVKFKEGEVVFVPKSIILETGTPGNLIDLQTRGIQITAAATKAKAAQAAQAAIREELIVKDSTSKALKESFLKSSDKVVLGYEVKALIENSFDISDDAAGLKNFGKELIFKGLSATGWRPESLLGKGSPEEKEAALVKQYGGRTKYNNQMQEVANRLLKRLLGEGSKNVSNVDRLLAQEISGLVKDISTGVSANPTLLRQRLKRILEMSEKDIEAGQTEMQQMYSEYSTRIQPGMPIGVKGASYSDRVLAPLARQSLLERGRAIRTPQQQKVFGSISGFTFKDGKYVVNQK